MKYGTVRVHISLLTPLMSSSAILARDFSQALVPSFPHLILFLEHPLMFFQFKTTMGWVECHKTHLGTGEARAKVSSGYPWGLNHVVETWDSEENL